MPGRVRTRTSLYLRANHLAFVGLGLAVVAVLALYSSRALQNRLPDVVTDVVLSTVVLVATLGALIFCLVSLARERGKVPALLGVAVVIAGETYRLPLILINAFTLLVIWLPALAIIGFVVFVVYLCWRRWKPETRA